MQLDKSTASALSDDAAVTAGLAKLAAVKGAKSAMAEQANGGDTGAEPASPEDAILALGNPSSVLLLYAPELEEAMAGDKVVRKMGLDGTPDEKTVEAVELVFADLPAVVQTAIEDLADASLAEIAAAGGAFESRGLTKDGDRWAAFLFLAAKLATMGHPAEEVKDSPEDIEQDAAAAGDLGEQAAAL